MAFRQCCEMAAVRIFFHQIVGDHTDPYTGEVNCTTMAEEAALMFNLYGPAPARDIPDWVYDYAVEVAEQHEEATCTSSM